MIYRLTWVLCRIFFPLLFRRKLIGVRNVPATGPVILAANHVSHLDPPAVATGIVRECACIAKEELFRNPAFAWYISHLNAFPVRRGEGDRAALKKSLELLKNGWPLLIFPEGTRSETGELQEPEMGVGMIAYRSGAPVVPVYVHGTNHALPRGGGLHLAPITIIYGEPILFTAPEGGKAGRDEYEAAAHIIMAAIARLRDEWNAGRC
jgi:1-acyl-sn-glycerol-3-phosphate acyltransferase